jgi:isoquinoline 1-oxidoreductase subunit beta
VPIFRATRRELLVGAGGATVVAGGAGLWLAVGRLGDRRFRQPVPREGLFSPSVYLSMQPDGDLVIWLTRSEMGQGVLTALPMLIAEEMDADWSRVRVQQASAEAGYDYGSMFTAASASITSNWIELRRAGAAARHMLVAAAAASWNVPARECTTADGVVTHRPSGRSLRYEAVADRAAKRRPPFRPALKSPAEFRLIGKPVPRLDVLDKISGKATYGLDVRLPGMRFAVIARRPVLGATLKRFDPTAALAVTGVCDVVEVPAGVAVVAETTFAAMKGRRALRTEWDPGPYEHLDSVQISRTLHARLHDAGAVPGVARDDGSAAARIDGDSDRVSAVFEVPYLAHATMEPMNCTAWIHDGRCEVWAPTQAPDQARRAAASVSGVPLERVSVHKTLLGGGFGRRAQIDYVVEAVAVAGRLSVPVQVTWSREDDMQHSPHRDAAAHRIQASLDADGYPAAWLHRIVSASAEQRVDGDVDSAAVMGASDLPYALRSVRVEWLGAQVPVPTTI